MRIPRIIRVNFWPLTYCALLWWLMTRLEGAVEAVWFSSGLCVAFTMWFMVDGIRPRRKPPEWRPVDYLEKAGDLAAGDVFFVDPDETGVLVERPALVGASAEQRDDRQLKVAGHRRREHPMIAGEVESGVRSATSMEDGGKLGLGPDARIRRVQATVTISAR